jgi:hypothetical protein
MTIGGTRKCDHFRPCLARELSLESNASTGKRPARYPFTAKVRATDLASGTQLDGITRDLSEGGCCILTREPFTRNTRILLEITKNGISLVTPASVAYSLTAQAMGLAFLGVPPDQMSILAGWLKDAIPTIRRNARQEQSGN